MHDIANGYFMTSELCKCLRLFLSECAAEFYCVESLMLKFRYLPAGFVKVADCNDAGHLIFRLKACLMDFRVVMTAYE